MATIAKQLAELIDPKPSFDPEDDICDETRARLIDKDLLDDEIEDLSTSQSIGRLRKLVALRDNDPKYKGKVVSRKQVVDDEDEDFSSNEKDNDPEEFEHHYESGSDREDSNIDVFGDDVEMEDDEDIDSDEAVGEEAREESEPAIFKQKKSEGTEKEKGRDTMNQMSLWESFVEARIKIQKLLGLANQLPRPSVFDEFLDQGGNDASASIKSATFALTKLGSETFNLQKKLLNLVDDQPSEHAKGELKRTEIYSNSGWNKAIEKRCTHLRSRRNRILKFWYDRTLLTNGNKSKSFSSFERPTTEQIDRILADRDRLIQRTRVQRSAYRVLGTTGEKEESEENHDARLKENEETFDDGDFYQLLLRQFIEQKTSQPTSSDTMQDSIDITRKWLKLQHLTTKTKKVVDTKASKGRKIRYKIHPKLVSFMAPIDKSSWTHEARNQLAKSMFGKSLFSSVSET